MKSRFSTTPKDTTADFLEANKHLITAKDVAYGIKGATVDYEDLRFMGLEKIYGTSFIPPTGGFQAGFHSPVYGHFVDDLHGARSKERGGHEGSRQGLQAS
jgi:hypothetical protein